MVYAPHGVVSLGQQTAKHVIRMFNVPVGTVRVRVKQAMRANTMQIKEMQALRAAGTANVKVMTVRSYVPTHRPVTVSMKVAFVKTMTNAYSVFAMTAHVRIVTKPAHTDVTDRIENAQKEPHARMEINVQVAFVIMVSV